MKLATYTPSVQKATSGNVRVVAPDISGPGKTMGRALTGLAGTINAVAENFDAVNAQAAANEYTKRVNELMYNQENGLMNTKFQGADGITGTFEEQERKIRQEVGSQYRFYSAKGQAVFNNMADRSAAQRYELVRKHQTQQYEAYQDVTFANAIDLNMQAAGRNYTSQDIVDDNIQQAVASASMRYSGQGEEVIKRQSRKAAGDVALSTINYALKDGDLLSASSLLDKYAGVIDVNKLPGIISNIRAQRENNFMIEKARELARSGLKGADLEAAIDGMQMPGITGSFDNLKKSMDATLGQPYKLGTAGNGSWDCGLWTQTMLNNNGENIQVRTADGQYAQMEREGRAFKDSSKLKPGDLVFWHTTDRWKYTDNPNAGADEAYKGISHVGIYVGNGKVRQAGGSGVSDIGLNDYEVIGFGRTAIGSAPQGRNLDATQRMKLRSLIMGERREMKRAEAEEKDAAFDGALQEFYTAGDAADPQAIARKYGGTDVVLMNTIAERLTKMKYGGKGGSSKEKGVGAAGMYSITQMIGGGSFDSKTDLNAFMLNKGYSQEEIVKADKLWEDNKTKSGVYAIPNLNQIIDTAIEGYGETKKLGENYGVQGPKELKLLLHEFALDYADSFYKQNHRNPNNTELLDALAKEVVTKKMILQSGGRTVTFNPLALTRKGITSADPVYVNGRDTGMVRLRYRNPDDSPWGRREVDVTADWFVREMGQENGNDSWLNFSKENEPVTEVTD